MDQRLHRALHLGARRRRDFAVVDLDRARRHLRQCLPDDAQRLPHLLDPHQVAVVGIAVAADRHVEIHFVVDIVGLRATQIPGDARTAQHRPGKPPVRRLLGGHDADVDAAFLENAVLGQQPLDVVDRLRERVAKGQDVLREPGRQVKMHPARTKIIRVQARPRSALVKLHQPLALLEAPQKRGQRADIQRERADAQQVIENTGNFGEHHANVLGARRRRDAHQLFNRQRESVLLAHWRHVIEPVEIRDRLQIGLVFDQLFGAAVEQPDMRVDPLDDLAVHFEDQPHHAMRRRMLRPEIHREILDVRRAFELAGTRSAIVGHRGPSPGVAAAPSPAFSSPGRILSMPSHGDKKSKLRNSCWSRTGS